MQIIKTPLQSNQTILALGAESAGNFSVYHKGQTFLSPNFDDLLVEKNFNNYKLAISRYIKKNKCIPTYILTDLHPLYHTTIYGQELAKKYKAKQVQVQHHYAHVCSAFGEYLSEGHALPKKFIGVACDGTGYGLDNTIWGGEVFKFQEPRTPPSLKLRRAGKNQKNSKFQEPKRFGSLETQTLLGGDLAVKEPARMLLAILHKADFSKEKIWQHLKKHYSKNQFELLYNQLLQNFNCQQTTSTARILDAAALLLGFCKNTRDYKHGPAIALEKNSTTPYRLQPRTGAKSCAPSKSRLCLSTTHLFKYLIKNLHKDKRKLAATVQQYLATGLYKIITDYKLQTTNYKLFFAGGIANNKIMSNFLENKGAYVNTRLPRGDASLSFGQLIYFLISKNPKS